MKKLFLIILLFLNIDLCHAQKPGPPAMYPKENQIVSSFISDLIRNDLEFHVIELEGIQRFDFLSFKKNYLVPSIFEDKKDENELIINTIENFAEEKGVVYYLPFIFEIRSKESDELWQPYWYILFLDKDNKPLGYTYYYP